MELQTPNTAIILDGRALAKQLAAEQRDDCAALVASLGFSPIVAVVLVGDDPASRAYSANIARTSARIGFSSRTVELPGDATEADLRAALVDLNADPQVCGVIVQMPLPAHISPVVVEQTLSPAKDIDGITPANAGRLALGLPSFVPNTPAGGIEMLRRHNIPIAGRRAVVVGRSNVVGKPMALLLLREHATVTVCHSRTVALPAILREADIVASATGHAHLIDGGMIKPGATVIDFGINFPEWSGGKMVGDVNFESAVAVAGAITPVPGGTGPVTNMMLMRNALAAAKALEGKQ